MNGTQTPSDHKNQQINNSNRRVALLTKRLIDIVSALVGCVCLIPLTVILWTANLLCGDFGPVFYAQERIGLHGKPFRLYKYRSMRVNADEELKYYLSENAQSDAEYEKYKKLKDDPRITRVGKIIRKTSLDEFPQFVNILKGEMSLVGPRPYLPDEREDMGDLYHSIILVKPGLTGPWQVGGRNDLTFEERLVIEDAYAKNPSLLKDAGYFFKTFFKILKKEGAS